MVYKNELDEIASNSIQGKNKSTFLPLIEFTEPLFFSIILLDKIFLGYVLQDRTVVNENSRADIKELYISESTFDDTLNMLNKTKTIYETLKAGKHKSRIGKIGERVFPRKEINNIQEIKDKIPNETYFLDLKLVPNLEYSKLMIQSRGNQLKKYSSNNQNTYYEKIDKENKIIKNIDEMKKFNESFNFEL